MAIPELHPDFADLPNLSMAEKKYASMVKMLDDHVGLIMAELKSLGLDEKTIVFFASDKLSAHYDFMATLADLVGVKPPAGKDSISYLPTLLGDRQVVSHDFVIVENHFNHMGSSALISRDGWKLIEIDRKKDQFQLYNIRNDNEERLEVSAQYPDLVSKLKMTLLRELDSSRPDL